MLRRLRCWFILDRGGNRGRYGNFNNEDGGGGGGGRNYDRGGPPRDGDDRYSSQNRYNRNDREEGDRPPADRAPTVYSKYCKFIVEWILILIWLVFLFF